MSASTAGQPSRRIGFVGLGKMGIPMVARLCGAGFDIHAYDVAPTAVQAVREMNSCTLAPSLRALADAVDVVITMLPDGGIVRQVVLGDDDERGLVAGLRPASLVVDMSSSHPHDTRRLGEALAEREISLVDAPVSGGVRRAVDGTLSVFVGGDQSDIDRVRGPLGAMGSRIFHAGGLGAGHTAKALNNLLSAACFAATIEVVETARAAGLDTETFAEVIDASSGRNNTTENKLRQFVLSGAYDSGFAIGLMAKDLSIADDLASSVSMPVPLSRQVVRQWIEAANVLGMDADHTAFAKLVPPVTAAGPAAAETDPTGD